MYRNCSKTTSQNHTKHRVRYGMSCTAVSLRFMFSLKDWMMSIIHGVVSKLATQNHGLLSCSPLKPTVLFGLIFWYIPIFRHTHACHWTCSPLTVTKRQVAPLLAAGFQRDSIRLEGSPGG